MVTIHKFEIPVADEFSIEMPSGARVLSAQTQRETPHIWALVDNENVKELRRFHLRGTGHDCTGLEHTVYVGTFQLRGGSLVFHLFAEAA